MRVLKEQDDKEWNEMQQQYNSSEESEEQRDEDYSWLDIDDKDNYFTLCTKFKNNYDKDNQIYLCYGRRTNNHLLSVYGFTLENNKYNSLQFRVVLDFSKSNN